jgi:hypothetical protein
MQAAKIDRPMATAKSSNKYIYFAFILVILLVIALYINNVYRALQPASLPQGTVTLSQSALEEQYGVHVNLVAVTGAGGFIDLRLKIVDGEKAKLLLADAKNFPVLFTEQGITLNASEDTKSQKIDFSSGGNLFIMYPNSGNALERDESVTILFGDIALEPITAK